jgi:hypothetical protein
MAVSGKVVDKDDDTGSFFIFYPPLQLENKREMAM